MTGSSGGDPELAPALDELRDRDLLVPFQHRGARGEDTVYGLSHGTGRYQQHLPERGRIGIFNRSHYEEVLVVRVHPELLAAQPLPENAKKGGVWKRRYREINEWEQYLVDNGVHVVKVLLNLSKREQAKRFLQRIDKTDKNWKFSLSDIQERQYWDDYQGAFDEMVSHTSTKWAPWYVVPADHKWFARLATAASSSAPSPRSTRGIRKSRPRSVTLWRRPAASWWPKSQAERCDGHLTDATSPAAPPLART